VTFTDSSTGTAPLSYAWDFNNDGNVDSTQRNPVYQYASAGTYTVRLAVTNAVGSDSETKTGYIVLTTVTPISSSDVGVFRPSTRQFIFNTVPVTRATFGLSTDIPVTGDWDGDGNTEVGVFRPSTRQFIFNTVPVTRATFGLSTDIPVTGDWDGDGSTEVGVFRPSTRQFIFNTVPVTRTTFGLGTDIPITGKWE
jgi:PKD repeat protein